MKKILLIEDNKDILTNTAEILELSNYKVVMADNGKTGVQKAIEQTPDLIICDIMMPGLDGYGVLHAIQKNDSIKNTPFIFLTAKTERDDFRKGMDLGADDYITKPYNVTELLNAIEGRIKKMERLKDALGSDHEGSTLQDSELEKRDALLAFTAGRMINKYKKKQIIYSEGNHPNRLFHVLKGKVKVFKTNDDGKELAIRLYSAGDFFGHTALFQKKTYSNSAEAIEESELAIIPREDVDHLLIDNTAVAKVFMEIMAKSINEMERQLLGLAYNSLRRKVADALLMFQNCDQNQEGEKYVINTGRENLASFAGTATESLIRTLMDFRDEKIIDLKDRSIIILDKHKLEQLSN